MESKTTPGPWRTDLNPYDQEWRVYSDGEGCPIINSLFHAHGERGEANARLIAAAPDLLAQLAKDAERFDFAAKRDPDQAGMWDCAAQECRAAIARAKGE